MMNPNQQALSAHPVKFLRNWTDTHNDNVCIVLVWWGPEEVKLVQHWQNPNPLGMRHIFFFYLTLFPNPWLLHSMSRKFPFYYVTPRTLFYSFIDIKKFTKTIVTPFFLHLKLIQVSLYSSFIPISFLVYLDFFLQK